MEMDIASCLTFEVKKELAERYFGFRKLIETDKQAFDQRLKEHSLTVEQELSLAVIRIYILLASEELISEFFALTGLDQQLFYDPYIKDSPTIRERLFVRVPRRGLTRAGKFKNMIFTLYEDLERRVGRYREKYGELLTDREMIDAEIKLFYQRNDLDSILEFFRRLDGTACGNALLGRHDAAATGSLADKMMVTPPSAVEEVLAIIPSIPALPRIRRQLKDLADRAFGVQDISWL